jgi:hypothetical protein
MEENPQPKLEMSVFGAPMRHDGHLYPVYPFYVEHIGAIPADGWEEILKSTNLTWVIIPERVARWTPKR